MPEPYETTLSDPRRWVRHHHYQEGPDGKIEADAQAVEKFFTEQYAPTGPFAKSTFDLKKDTVRFITPDVALSDWEVVVTGSTQPDGAEAEHSGIIRAGARFVEAMATAATVHGTTALSSAPRVHDAGG